MRHVLMRFCSPQRPARRPPRSRPRHVSREVPRAGAAVARADAAMGRSRERLFARLNSCSCRRGRSPDPGVAAPRREVGRSSRGAPRRIGRTSFGCATPRTRPGVGARARAGVRGQKVADRSVRRRPRRPAGVLRPIGRDAACTRCHGRGRSTPTQGRALSAYPQDPGDRFLAGRPARASLWAEVKALTVVRRSTIAAGGQSAGAPGRPSVRTEVRPSALAPSGPGAPPGAAA